MLAQSRTERRNSRQSNRAQNRRYGWVDLLKGECTRFQPVSESRGLLGSEPSSDSSSRVVFVSPADGGGGVFEAAWFMRVRK